MFPLDLPLPLLLLIEIHLRQLIRETLLQTITIRNHKEVLLSPQIPIPEIKLDHNKILLLRLRLHHQEIIRHPNLLLLHVIIPTIPDQATIPIQTHTNHPVQVGIQIRVRALIVLLPPVETRVQVQDPIVRLHPVEVHALQAAAVVVEEVIPAEDNMKTIINT